MDEDHAITFEDIIGKLSDQLFVYLKRMVGTAELADDLLQETLMKIAIKLPSFEYRSSLKTWVFKIATNVAYDYLRKQKKHQLISFDDKDRYSFVDESDRLVLDEMNDCVREIINTLPPDYRSAIILYNLQGKSIEETAEICNISIENAKIRIHRAKTHLKLSLDKECIFYKTPEGTLRCDKK